MNEIDICDRQNVEKKVKSQILLTSIEQKNYINFLSINCLSMATLIYFANDTRLKKSNTLKSSLKNMMIQIHGNFLFFNQYLFGQLLGGVKRLQMSEGMKTVALEAIEQLLQELRQSFQKVPKKD